MHFAFPTTGSALSLTKLPKEDQLRQHMDRFTITDPYDAKIFPTLEHCCITVKKPKRGSNRIDDCCIGSSFRDPNITPGWDMEQVPRSLHFDPVMTEDWPGWLVHALKQHDKDFIHTRTYTVRNGRQLGSIKMYIERFISDTLSEQTTRFITKLNHHGYVKKRSEPKLHEEVCRRRAQFPGQKIYVVLGGELASYFDAMYESNRWHDTYLTFANYNYYMAKNLDSWDSAVFTAQQFKAAQRFFIHYGLKRVPRAWEIAVAAAVQFNLEVDDCIQEEKVLKKKNLGRFGMLI